MQSVQRGRYRPEKHTGESMSGEEEVTLENLAGGGAAEMFEAAIAQVVENVLDPNTDAKSARKITLEVTIRPTSTDRRQSSARVSVKTKLAPANDLTTTLYMGKVGEKYIAAGIDRRQIPLFQPPGKEQGVAGQITPQEKV